MKNTLKSFKSLLKTLEIRWKNSLLRKLGKVRKENRYLKKELQEQVLEKYGLYDEISNKQREIRELRLKYEKTKEG